MLRRPCRPAREAFTLVELLVVIAIIIVLLGLLLPAVQKVRIIGKRAQATNEISQLTNAAAAFKNDWGQVPPNAFCLPVRPGGNSGPNAAIMDASFAFLQNKYGGGSGRWPRAGVDLDAAGNIIWDASWTATFAYNTNSNANPVLQGNQCMLLFLSGPTQTGWALDRPAAPSNTATSKMFYLDVPQSKLNLSFPNTAANYGYPSPAPVYVDPFGMPYAYFGSNKVGGKYNPLTTTFTSNDPVNATSQTISAYLEANGKFLNENGCQIISAGENRMFGPGGVWTPGGGNYATGLAGFDDMANFNEGKQLGVR